MPDPVATRLASFPLVLGGNVFGWTADAHAAGHILDGFQAAGGLMIDTADGYSSWVPGNEGGESERIIGDWMNESDTREEMLIATKVSSHPAHRGLAPNTIRAAIADSLERLQIDTIDLYYAHYDDESVPLTETARAFHALVDEGLIGEIGVSNYTASRIAEWLSIADSQGYARPTVVQPHYNLLHRTPVEETILPLARAEGLAVLPYAALASGFLTGKYTKEQSGSDSPRSSAASRYANDTGWATLAVLAELAGKHRVEVATIAIAWLSAQPGVTAPIASVSHPDQLKHLLAVPRTTLTDDEIAQLDEVTAA